MSVADITNATMSVLDDVADERLRQHERWGEQHLRNGTPQKYANSDAKLDRRLCEIAVKDGTVTWRHILQEEVSEAFAEWDERALREELVQVAATAVQWIEAIDRRKS